MKPEAIIYADPNNSEDVPGKRLSYFYMHGEVESRTGYDCCNANIDTFQRALRRGTFIANLQFPDGVIELCIVNSDFSYDGHMSGIVALLTDIEAIKYAFKDVKYYPSLFEHERIFIQENYPEIRQAIKEIVDENNMSLTEKIRRFNDSPEGEKAMDEFVAKIKLEEERKDRWIDKVIKKISTLSELEFEAELKRFFDWEEEYEEFFYTERHVQTTSELFSVLIDAIEKLGDNFESSEDFYARGHIYRGYIFKIFCGQGCFTRVEKDGKIVFQST